VNGVSILAAAYLSGRPGAERPGASDAWHIVSAMASWEDVDRIALGLPDVAAGTGDLRDWRVRGRPMAWERPLRRADLEALGDAAPRGPILGARVPDLGAKEALLAADPEVYFTTPHFDGYPAILVRLDDIELPELEELIVEAWLKQAPKRLAAEFLRTRG
jgi:hypothetical protein